MMVAMVTTIIIIMVMEVVVATMIDCSMWVGLPKQHFVLVGHVVDVA